MFAIMDEATGMIEMRGRGVRTTERLVRKLIIQSSAHGHRTKR